MAGDRSMSVFRSFGCFFFFNDTATTEIYTYGPLFPYTTLFRSFLVDGAAVVLTAPAPAASTGPKRTASGSFAVDDARARVARRSEEHTSELQSLMRISYAVFCLIKKPRPTHYPPSILPYS